jgi:ketosteroid isomerase-like protein
MNDENAVRDASLAMADAIARRDVNTIAVLLAPGFVHHTPGGETTGAERFLAGIGQIPGEIAFVRLEDLKIDVAGDGALVTGIQHARVRIDGQDLDDRRAFVDWFVRHDGRWRFRAAVDLPAPAEVAAG